MDKSIIATRNHIIFLLSYSRFMYTGQLDVGEGSVPTLVATAQFLDMPLLEQLLQTHAIAATNNTPVATPKAKVNKTPVRGNYSTSPAQRINRTPKQELLPAGPSRIDLEVGFLLEIRYLFIAYVYAFIRLVIPRANSAVYRNFQNC